MHFSFRFIEYAIVGSFFWVIQFSFLTLGGNDGFGFFYNLADSYEKFITFATSHLHLDSTDPLKGSIENLLATLSIIMVFATGLLMEMLSIIFVFTEVDVFTRHLKHNVWVTSFAPADHPGMKNDYQALTEPPHSILRRVFSPILLIRNYKRLYHLLFSYIIVHGGSFRLDYLFDQLSIRRTSRGVSASILFLYIQFLIQKEHSIPGYIIAIALGCFAVMIVRYFFGQVCNQLFSLAYVITTAGKKAE